MSSFLYTIVPAIPASNELGAYTNYSGSIGPYPIESYTSFVQIFRIRYLYQKIVQQNDKIPFRIIVHSIRYFNISTTSGIKISCQWLSLENWDSRLIRTIISSIKKTMYAPLGKSRILSTSSSWIDSPLITSKEHSD